MLYYVAFARGTESEPHVLFVTITITITIPIKHTQLATIHVHNLKVRLTAVK